MDVLKLHLVLNYYPAIGFVIATLIFAGAIRFRSVPAQRFALKLIVFFAILTLGVALTGEFAGRAQEPYIDGARAAALEGHRIFATIAFVLVEATGVAALVSLVRGRRDTERGKTLYTIILLLAAVSSVLLIAVVLKGRQVKWAAERPGTRPALLTSIDMEKRIWHA